MSAAPCPVDVKRQMIEWWGPIIHEYYGATERIGLTEVRQSRVADYARAFGRQRQHSASCIFTTSRRNELPAVEDRHDLLRTARDAVTEYHNDDEKTKAAQHPVHLNW